MREISPEQWELLEKCWHANPQERPAFKEGLKNPNVLKVHGLDENRFYDYILDLTNGSSV
jgi:hypothetical protein